MVTNARKPWMGGVGLGWPLAGVTAAALLSACASGGSTESTAAQPAPGAPAAPPAFTEAGPSVAPLGYRLEWRGFPQVASDGLVRFFDFLDDGLVVHDDRNVVTVMESDTGRNRWSVKAGPDIAKFVGNVQLDRHVLVCSESDIQFLDIKTGQLKDRQRLAVITNTEPVLMGEMAIFGCATGEVLGHNTRSGYKLWGHMLSGRIAARGVEVDGNVGVVSDAGEVVILNPANGESQGRRQKIFGGIDNHPVAGDGKMFVAGRDQSIWAFNAGDGRQAWRHRTEASLREQPTFHDGRLYQTVPGQGLVCLDASNGQVIWTARDLSATVIGVRSGRLLAWTGSELLKLDAARGDVVARVEMPGIMKVKTDAFVDGNLYTIAQRGGRIEKFSPWN